MAEAEMASVTLYVYDLSHGLVKAMSMNLIGKQIDGIWYAMQMQLLAQHASLWWEVCVAGVEGSFTCRHTAVVVHGMEIFFGGGIQMTAPVRFEEPGRGWN